MDVAAFKLSFFRHVVPWVLDASIWHVLGIAFSGK